MRMWLHDIEVEFDPKTATGPFGMVVHRVSDDDPEWIFVQGKRVYECLKPSLTPLPAGATSCPRCSYWLNDEWDGRVR